MVRMYIVVTTTSTYSMYCIGVLIGYLTLLLYIFGEPELGLCEVEQQPPGGVEGGDRTPGYNGGVTLVHTCNNDKVSCV